MSQLPCIIVADDHPLFRQALIQSLTPHFMSYHWHEANNIAELEPLLSAVSCQLLLLDLEMPDAHGISSLVQIVSQHPKLPVVAVSAHEEPDVIAQVMRSGAAGYIPKSTPVPELVEAILGILEGKRWYPEHLVEQARQIQADTAERIASLTPQQFRILKMFSEGLLNKQIAIDIGISEATVKAHATSIFRKLGVYNRTQAVILLSQLEFEPHHLE